jgi:hypothetical protein
MLLNAEEMALHCFAGTRCITFFDGANDPFMLGKAMMIERRFNGIGAEPSPNNGTAHSVQRIEQRQKHCILRCFGDGSMKPVIPIFVLPPRFGEPRRMHALMHFGDVVGAGGYCRFAGDSRFDHEACLHNLARIGSAGNCRNPRMFLNRPGAQERTSTNMAPKFAVPFQHEQCFAQLATRNAENIRQLTFRRKPTLPRLGTLRQISLQLSQRALLLIHNRTPRKFAIPCTTPVQCPTNSKRLRNQSRIG